jgi:hypothetical protein
VRSRFSLETDEGGKQIVKLLSASPQFTFVENVTLLMGRFLDFDRQKIIPSVPMVVDDVRENPMSIKIVRRRARSRRKLI